MTDGEGGAPPEQQAPEQEAPEQATERQAQERREHVDTVARASDLITASQFAQRQDIRVRDVKQAANKARLGVKVEGVKMYYEDQLMEILGQKIEQIRRLRSRQVYYRVLAVDDDVENCDMIERILRKEFKVFRAQSGDDGLEILRRESIEVIIADQRMPGMSGTEFLTRSLRINPHTIRLMLSAYTDPEALAEAINEAKVHHFLSKPVDRDTLLKKVRAAFEVLAANRHLMAIELGQDD
ncbi:MAG: response regulator [Myxococcales bacterium]|nr:response regulator [Myxococcales bacterium]